jgi:putative endopeptidase
MRRTLLLLTGFSLLLTGFLASYVMTAAADTPGPVAAAPDLASHSLGTWGVELGDRDPTVKPGDDFYLSQNGGWLKRQPDDNQLRAYWRDLRRLAPRRVAAVLTEISARKDLKPGSVESKASAFYRAFLDADRVETVGADALKPELDVIRAAGDLPAMAAVMGHDAGPGIQRSLFKQVLTQRALFNLDIAQDRVHTDRNTVYLGQGGLLMPGPEYYLDPKLADFKKTYQDYVEKMLTLIAWPDAKARAADVVSFETRVAEVSWSHEQLLDAVKTYNPVKVADLRKSAPGFDWTAFFKAAGLADVDEVVLDAKDAIPRIAAVYAATPIAVLQARQAFAAADENGPYLSTAFVAANFEFRTRVFLGAAFPKLPRDVQAETALESFIPDILGKFYVDRYSSPEAKAHVEQMAEFMRTALDTRLQHLAWMSEATRAKARAKLARMRIKVGYPAHFDSYNELELSETDLYGDVVQAKAYNWHTLVDRLHKPFDRDLWFSVPEYPNYNFLDTTDTVEIPAALLQPPFFDLKADDAVNYGAVGALLAESMYGAFSLSGRHFDADGKLHDWWTPAETAYFDKESAKLSAQYSAVEVLLGLHVQGQLVLNEAVMDLGAMQLLLDAYHLSLHDKTPPVLDGFTGDQRVFLGRAQMWRVKFPEAFIRNLVATGANAPPFMRINASLRNTGAWYETFDVKPGDKMYIAPEDRVRLW